MHRQHKALTQPIEFMLSGIAFDAKPTTHAEYAAWNDSFGNKMLDCPLDLISYLAGGYAFTNPHVGPRRKENWRDAQYVGIDLEKHQDAALDTVEKNEFFRTYGFASYTTFSHTESEPRSRALFILDKPVPYVQHWHAAARAIMGFFGQAVDKASADISRAFLGNPSMECRIYGNVLPYDALYVLAQQQLKLDALANGPSRQRDNGSVRLTGASLDSMNRWLDELRRTADGNRNNTLNRIAFMVGRYIVGKQKIDESYAIDLLVSAGIDSGLDEFECRRTVIQSIRKGSAL